MRSFFALVFGSPAFFLLGAITFAQGVPDSPEAAPVLHEKTEVEKYVEGIRTGRNQPPAFREERVLKKGLLAPSQADRLAFAEFLRLRNTGLVRLLPREVYDSETYRTKKRINIRGGGAYYSFADLTHSYGFGNDLELDHNILSVGFAGADYGMLTKLGDQPLADITINEVRARFIAEYKPPKPEPAARSEFRRFQKGATIDGVLYRSRLPVEVGTTYLLRSIVYRTSDVLVAFRVVRKDTDGSVIIAWKLLKEYPVPQLTRTN
jgi:hypothetical protein